MIRWEYKVFRFESGDKIVDKMNVFGADGWEAFHFAQRRDGSTHVLFKRLIPPTPTTGEPS
jgi:hypothetical protein